MCLDAPELASPVLGEHPAPVVNRSQRLGVGPIQGSSPVPPHHDQTDAPKYLQVFGYRGLLEPEGVTDFADRSLIGRNEFEDVTTTGFGDRVKGI
jgi:hypothetical protein